MNIPLIIGLLFAAFSALMLRLALRNLSQATASLDWSSTAGTLVEARLWGTRNVDGKMVPAEHLVAEYRYEVSGQDYRGTAVAFYTLVYPETTEFVAAHPIGPSITVHYNPDAPAQSVLIRGPRPGPKRNGELILAGLGLMIGLAVAFMGSLGLIG
jgi:hypothetical protein